MRENICEQCGTRNDRLEQFCVSCQAFLYDEAGDMDLIEVNNPSETNQVTPEAVEVTRLLVDIAVSVASAGVFEGGKYLLRSVASNHRAKNERVYSEDELVERSQRALASRLSVQFDQLQLSAIETTPQGEAVADFRMTTNWDLYRVTTQIIDGITVITRLQHEILDTRH
jgi:hypothetical protein